VDLEELVFLLLRYDVTFF